MDEALIRDTAEALRQLERVTVMTGAGISAESGIPTFRDANTGIWARFSPLELATPEAFANDPARVWDWYTWRRKTVSEATPNVAHEALADMATRFSQFTLITQNVDGLHQRAGSNSVIELHGNILRSICHLSRRVIEPQQLGEGRPPASPHHPDGLARPDVVWFGEALPEDALLTSVSAAESCQAFISIGTSSQVEPAASLAHTARRADAWIIEVNPDPTPLTPFADFSLRGRAAEILPSLLREIRLF